MADRPSLWRILPALLALVLMVVPVVGPPLACSGDGADGPCCCAPAIPAPPSSCCEAPAELPERDPSPCACLEQPEAPAERIAFPAPIEHESVRPDAPCLVAGQPVAPTFERVLPVAAPPPDTPVHALNCVYLS